MKTVKTKCAHHANTLSYFFSPWFNLLCPSCLSDWKPVSVHVFGMKHLWDVHFLLLILLYLLGAVTSQVNPGPCFHALILLCYDFCVCVQVPDCSEITLKRL